MTESSSEDTARDRSKQKKSKTIPGEGDHRDIAFVLVIGNGNLGGPNFLAVIVNYRGKDQIGRKRLLQQLHSR